MNIVILNGGATQGSRTRGLARTFEQALNKNDINVTFFDLGEHVLPVYNGSDEQYQLTSVKALQSLTQEADGFVICTPEYHNGMSGALKNALDFLGSRQFRNKPTLIAAAAGGGKGGINALNNLRTVMRGVYALVLPDQFVADPHHFNDQQKVTDYDAQERINGMAEELIRISRLLAAK
ncbi:NAD(P)H-dependent oxidoreductase [Brevibacillus fluminis]|uniref:NAD(P)H-dependent oxidoreductase n=1 Tax=Brevibacillus fluminis TaxID=511487 RepID=A0A3M8CKJ4_9BACL|nr:NADPH-dependent FMN reductase [Brevibacillus fluminis]RNB76230.1 NAD(P)H-dependent oxidoreductase [Brevibacillus fluminis]